MDPLAVLPEELHDSIFQYLSGGDILELSLVSKRWYEKLGKSTVCMRKLTIYSTNPFGVRDSDLDYDLNYDFNSLMESNRQYRRFYFTSDRYKIISKMILTKFASSVEYITTNCDYHNIGELPKLHTIKFSRDAVSLYPDGILATNVEHIERLEFIMRVEKDSRVVLKEALKRSRKLKVLQLYDNIFESSISEYEFPVLNTLRLIHEDSINKSNLDFIMARIPKLSTLHVRGGINPSQNNESTERVINETVINLHFDGNFDFTYLLNFKCVQNLHITRLDRELTRIILFSRSIKTVHYSSIDESCLDILDIINAQEKITFHSDY